MAMLFRGLEEDNYDRQYTDIQLYRRIGSYFAKYKRQLAAVFGTALAASIMLSLRPVIIAAAVGALGRNTEVNTMVLLVGALLVTVLIEYAGNWVRRRMAARAIGGVVAQMRRDAFEAAVERDMSFYDRNKSGKVVSRITSDTQEFGTVVLLSSDILSQLVSVFVLVAILFDRSVQLTWLVLALSPVIVAGSTLFRHFARITTRNGARALGLVNDNIQESVAGISIAKNFRKEASIYERFNEVNTTSYNVNIVRGVVLASIFPVLNTMAGIATAIIVYFGARAVLDASVTPETWYLFIQSIDRFWFPFITLSAFVSQFQQGLSSTERVFALIDAENTVTQTGDVQVDDSLTGKIELRDVTFGYKKDEPVMENFSLTMAPGENVAFVGHTGAGKSTIAKLISRFYEYQSGDILVDEMDIRSFDLQSYRNQLGIVSQTPFLFSGTVRDNIRYAKQDATDDEINDLAHSIGDGDWIETLPNGLDSDVGERGARLSMGQRQLVSLMRVLLQKPSIFILDEATASIDPFTETQIQEALDLILASSTSILIAHRLSTVRSADRIIVLDHGSIIEQGNHEELMEQGGHYADLYNTYFRHQSLDYIENARSQFRDNEESAEPVAGD
ncbi:MAG: ABC transporter ATP-binding protein [Chloroflexota bacterium]